MLKTLWLFEVFSRHGCLNNVTTVTRTRQLWRGSYVMSQRCSEVLRFRTKKPSVLASFWLGVVSKELKNLRCGTFLVIRTFLKHGCFEIVDSHEDEAALARIMVKWLLSSQGWLRQAPCLLRNSFATFAKLFTKCVFLCPSLVKNTCIVDLSTLTQNGSAKNGADARHLYLYGFKQRQAAEA